MNKINFYLQSRLDSIKKRAEGYAKYSRADAYKAALEWQTSYGRKGWIKYDSPNDYDDKGNMRLYNLDSFDAVPIQEISRRAFDYSGYYADNFQMELVKPYIVKIKTGRGLFIAPAIAYSDCDIATIYLSDGEFCPNDENSQEHYEAAYSAARIADSIAEREAEKSREADAQYQAESQSDDLKAENIEALKEARALIAAIREQKTIGAIVGPICAALISEIKSIRSTIRANNRRIQALKTDYWQAVS